MGENCSEMGPPGRRSNPKTSKNNNSNVLGNVAKIAVRKRKRQNVEEVAGQLALTAKTQKIQKSRKERIPTENLDKVKRKIILKAKSTDNDDIEVDQAFVGDD